MSQYIQPYPAYVYKITCLWSQEYYFGSRYANITCKTYPVNDLFIRYFSSSRVMQGYLKLHDKSEFKTEILKEDTDIESIFWSEQDYIKAAISDPLCLNKWYRDNATSNKVFCSFGKPSHLKGTKQSQDHINKAVASRKNNLEGKDHSLVGKKLLAETREQVKNKKQQTWASRTAAGIKRSEKIRNRQLEIWNNKTQEELYELTQERRSRYQNQSDDWKISRSKSLSSGIKQWHETKDPELEKQRIENMMQTKKLKQLRYIHNKETTTIKQVPLAELDNWLNAGWAIGMGIKRSTQSSSSPSLS